MNFIKRFIVIAVTVTLGISLLGAIPVLAIAPSGGSVTIGPEPAYTDTDITATLSGWDETGAVGEITYGYEWQKSADGVTWETIGGAIEATLYSTNTAKDDQIRVICTPSDDTGDGTPAISNVITISGGIVVITPDPAYTDSILLATPTHWAGGETFTYQWQIWDEGTTGWLGIGGTTDTLVSSNFGIGDQVQVTCTPFDGTDYGDPVYADITISGGIVVITPDPAYTDSTLLAAPMHWAGGETFTYQWQFWDGDSWEPIAGDPTGDTLASSNFDVGDQIKVICTPAIDDVSGTPVEAIVSITAFNYDAGIDVKPGSEENPINLKSKGVIPVAVYTTEGFDATTVDIGTVKFGPNEIGPVHYAYEDIDNDGDIDLILHFRTQDTGISEEDTTVTLTGVTDSGMAFTGTDVIKIVPSKAEEAVQGNESAPGQSKGPGESAEGKAKGKESAPGQIKGPGESAEGKAKGKNK